ncbi:amidohydrolase [Desertifilum sp. FACHB-1129]|uniref:BarH protein n=1 Tax=Desertifilum tharense IPPAS B-1220 TaxID=1781255 RepID=A0A1E5QQL0_9CYAN|nr:MULTISPECIES: amidohydrolase family protein [Desertifilum]MDA0213492.1 amidohydrolase family protein [Cyanobacteria bacterium FC1]MBD2314355.1 amidohydrolase [Desertifilum sp. FACHB-1129]MBD2323288.1 amidohydrolase [Desertifilum sp. FACHB-866]MBD2333133.1 amidohydrolase [Desertifilum sp. FACHB-868]OEJ76965.1 BarH protein [Desertifilum tharense IPPAS B-1220]
MLNGYQIIDADSHVYEPHQMWLQYLEPAFRGFALSADLKIKGESIVNPHSERLRQEAGQQAIASHPRSWLNQFDAESQVQAMYQMGVDIAFIYPTYFSWVIGMDAIAPQLAGAYVRAYNNWLQDFCSYNPQILRGVGVVNPHAPEEMVPELERIADWGWKAVFLRPNPVKGRILSDRAYEPFWSACEALEISVSLHEGTHSRSPTAGSDRFETRFALHACSHPMEQMMALLALIEGGVLERHPQLKVGLLESGCGWIPYWLWRLDREYEDLRWEVGDRVKLKPSEYFRRQCFIAMEPNEPYLAQFIDAIGADNLIFGSDYPHMDHRPNGVAEVVALETQLSPEIIHKIVWDNPKRFYHLTP